MYPVWGLGCSNRSTMRVIFSQTEFNSLVSRSPFLDGSVIVLHETRWSRFEYGRGCVCSLALSGSLLGANDSLEQPATTAIGYRVLQLWYQPRGGRDLWVLTAERAKHAFHTTDDWSPDLWGCNLVGIWLAMASLHEGWPDYHKQSYEVINGDV